MTYSIADLQHEALSVADIRFDPSDAQPDYIGLAQQESADTAESYWVIYKFTYSDSSIVRIQKARGAWDDRVTLF